jgi:hypothetical protein
VARKAIVAGQNGAKVHDTQLHYAEADAAKIAAALSSPRYGFEIVQVNGSVTAASLRERIEHVAETCVEDDDLLIFFAGHGWRERGTLFLVLDGSDINYPLTTMLAADDVLRALRFSRAKHKLLILDCCEAGTVIEGARFRDTPPRMTEIIGGLPNSRRHRGEVFVVLMASDRLEQAREFDFLGGGFLSHWLCEALGPCFQEADADGDGVLELDDVMVWLETKASAHNELHPTTPVPAPFLFGQKRHRFALTRDLGDWTVHIIRAAGGILDLVVLPARDTDPAGKEEVFCIGKTPVTNAQFREYWDVLHRDSDFALLPFGSRDPPVGKYYPAHPLNGGYGLPDGAAWEVNFRPWDRKHFNEPEQPVVCVSLHEARRFATWIERGCPGAASRISAKSVLTGCFVALPWLWDLAAFGVKHPVRERSAWLQKRIAPRGSAPYKVAGDSAERRVGLFGTIDLLGNVWEWCEVVDHTLNTMQIRGGSYINPPDETEPFAAITRDDELGRADIGFRIAGRVLMSRLPAEVADQVRNHPAAVALSETLE